MPTLKETFQLMRDAGDFKRLALDPNMQFGTSDDPYLGASLLPEVNKAFNAYSETQIRYQSAIANSGGSLSPAQRGAGGRIFGEFRVFFGNTNIFDDLPAAEFKTINDLLLLSTSGSGDNATLQAMATILRFFDNGILQPILSRNELERWMGIIDNVIKRRGNNLYAEDVTLPNPGAGHRVTIPSGTIAAPTGWYSTTASAYNPLNDFIAARMFLAKKGYKIDRIISAFEPAFAFQKNPAIQTQVGGTTVVSAGLSVGKTVGIASADRINLELQANGLPVWEIYDRTYNYPSSSSTKPSGLEVGRYLERGTAAARIYPVVCVCKTGRDESLIDFGDRSTLPNGGVTLKNTLGYFGIGTVAGQAGPGRYFYEEVTQKHPGGLYAEGIQEGLPVITEPEAIYIMNIPVPV